MNSQFLQNTLRFVSLILMQVVVFNNQNIFGYINVYPYILFVILYPIGYSRYGLLFASFLLGLTVDMFSNSGGMHAASCICLAFFRHNLFRISFGINYEHQIIKIPQLPFKEQFIFIFFSTLIHHLVLFSLEAFTFTLALEVLIKTVLSTIFTTIFSLLIINIFKTSKR
ncbi:MAG: rod shape-determining protein MreD [Bacteroidota bacterium]|nr:rod shape-determining protein MreD [Bacteroidota bacterium]